MAYSSAVALTVYPILRSGAKTTKNLIAPTATHGNKFLGVQGRTFLRVVNGSGDPITVTINSNRTIDGLTLPNATVTIAATADADGLDDQLIGPFTGTFEQDDGYVWVTFSAVATVTVGAFSIL